MNLGQVAWFESLASIINVIIILTKLFSGKIHIIRTCICFLFLVLPCTILSIYYRDETWGSIFSVVGTVLILAVPLVTVTNVTKSFTAYLSLFYIGASSALIISCIWIARSLKFDETVSMIIDIAFHCLLFVLLMLISFNIISLNFLQQIILLPRYLKILLLVFVWFSDSLAYFLSSFFSYFPSSRLLLVIEILCALLIMLSGLLWPLLITNNLANVYYRNVANDVEKQMEKQIVHYQQTIQTNKEIRKFRHDFKNLKLALLSSLKKEDTEAAIQCLNEFDKPFNSQHILFETGNPVADVLLSEKHTIALTHNIKVKFDGLFPDNMVSPSDVCVILGNAIDNAIEACLKLPAKTEKVIKVLSGFNNGFLYLSILNPVLTDIKIKNNTISTTKQDKSLHGIGLYSINRAVKKYDGDLKLECINQIFELKVTLDLHSFV